MYLLSLELKEDHRCLKTGLYFDLKPITLLVGEQGCGKSSLLTLLQKNSKMLKLELSESVFVNGVSSFFFDSETMNPRMCDLEANYTNVNGSDKGIGLGSAIMSKFKSHGETLREFTVNRIKDAKNCVLLLDEPESALSIRNQYKLAKEIKEAVNRNCQIIIATHCLPLIESIDTVYSLEHKQWMTSKEFIEESIKNI